MAGQDPNSRSFIGHHPNVARLRGTLAYMDPDIAAGTSLPRLVSASGAAAILGRTPQDVRNLAKAKRLYGVQLDDDGPYAFERAYIEGMKEVLGEPKRGPRPAGRG